MKRCAKSGIVLSCNRRQKRIGQTRSDDMSRHEPHFVSRYFLKMMLSYCLVIVVGLGLVSVFTTSWVTPSKATT